MELAARTPPDLVMMDLKMPGMNGVEATRRLSAQRPETKVLVLTIFAADNRCSMPSGPGRRAIC